MLIVVAAALVDSSGKVLVQQRPDGKSMAGLWEFPGGKVEVGETPEDALARELREELGIAINSETTVPHTFSSEAADGRHLLLLLYVCRDWTGDAAPLHADAIRWVGRETLAALSMPPADQPFVAMLAPLLAG